jgi:hypothetical protein
MAKKPIDPVAELLGLIEPKKRRKARQLIRRVQGRALAVASDLIQTSAIQVDDGCCDLEELMVTDGSD